jgi:hypothetical protein
MVYSCGTAPESDGGSRCGKNFLSRGLVAIFSYIGWQLPFSRFSLAVEVSLTATAVFLLLGVLL